MSSRKHQANELAPNKSLNPTNCWCGWSNLTEEGNVASRSTLFGVARSRLNSNVRLEDNSHDFFKNQHKQTR